MTASNFQLIATTAFGLESIVGRELQQLGIAVDRAENGYVLFHGDAQVIAQANLWLRTADRVLIVMGQFRAETFDALFEGTKAIAWEDVLPSNAHFPVEGRSVRSTLQSVPACQSIVKKAIVERLKQHYPLEVFPEDGPRFDIEISILKDDVMVTLDTSGAGLHRRGYRTLNAVAPLRETLAAALVLLSRWQPHRPFADPLCGSGTIAIEAAMIGRNLAPGLNRRFAFESFGWLPESVAVEERESARAAALPSGSVRVAASDISTDVLRLAAVHCRQADVENDVVLDQASVAQFSPTEQYGCIVTNPPYGERLGEKTEAESLYRQMGRVFGKLDTWSVFVITSHPSFERLYGKPADKRRKLYNGRIQTQLFQYLGPLPPRPSQL